MTTRAWPHVVLAGRAPATLFTRRALGAACGLLSALLAGCGHSGGSGFGGSSSLEFLPLFGPAQLISSDAPGVGALASGDFDGDGDRDVLAVSQLEGSVVWHENLDGAGGSWTAHVVSSTASGANSVAAVDLDCDGDLDAVVASFAAGLRWYENLDGLGLDWGDHQISLLPEQPMGLFAGDLDRDGDNDVVSGSFAGGAVVCFLNDGGQGSSWTAHAVATGESAPIAVAGASVDGGDCTDLLVASAYSGRLAWHDDSGCLATSWPRTEIASGLATPVAVVGADADGDGDLDALSASMSDDRIDLHRNLDGSGASWERIAVSTASDGVRSLWAGDLDCDGDVDLISGSQTGDLVAWHENAGEDATEWITRPINEAADGVSAILGADIDGDGLTDAVSASTNAGTIEWYRNQLPGDGPVITDPPDQSVCRGGTVSFTTTPTGPGPFAYEWVVACTGEVVGETATLTLVDVQPEDACTYEVRVTSAFRTVAESAVLTVLEEPSATDPPDQSVCAGSGVTLATTAAGSGPFSYVWTKSGANGVLSTASTLTIASASAGDAGLYTVAVSNACGAAVQSVSLAVNQPVAASKPLDQSVCAGASVSFATTASGTGPFTYQWTKLGSPAVLGTGPSLALPGVGAANAGTYTVLVTGACGSVAQSAQLQVDEPVSLVGPFDTAVCAGATVTLSTAASGAGPYAYTWTAAGSNEVLSSSSALTIASVDPGDVGSYTVTVSGPCGSASKTIALELAVVVSIMDPPDQVACPGSPVSFATSAAGTGPFAYAWTHTGSSTVIGTGSVLSLGPAVPALTGSYTVTVTGACGQAVQTTSLVVAEPVDAASLADQSVVAGTTGVTLGPVLPTGTGPFLYSWTKNGVGLPGQTGPQIEIPQAFAGDAGSYCVTVTGPCTAVSRCVQLAVTDVDPSSSGGRKLGSLLVFPVHRSLPGAFSVLSVTNTSMQVQTPVSLGGTTNLHFEYVNATPNPANPFRPLSCDVFDRVETLTPADTLSVTTTCHNPSLGGLEGYVVVSAQDPTQFSVPWSHNHLVGSELVLAPTGGAFTLDAIVFSAVPQAGASTDLDGDGTLDLDGQEYTQVADTLLVPAFLAPLEARLTLLNLTGAPLDVNTVRFTVWNDNEFQLSAEVKFNCWFDEPLTAISPLFSNAFLAGTPNDPGELDDSCDGVQDMEVGWMLIDSAGVATPGGDSVALDGALLGALTGTSVPNLSPGELLWESRETQDNGAATSP